MEDQNKTRLYDTIVLQRLEGLVALVAGLAVYANMDQSWWLFAALFLVPDLAMLGYLKSPALGATTYNLAHTYVAPALLALIGMLAMPSLVGIAVIWFAHIGFDRMIGAGLKYRSGFNQTHLGTMGRHKVSAGGA
jgi:hypothetical protein